MKCILKGFYDFKCGMMQRDQLLYNEETEVWILLNNMDHLMRNATSLNYLSKLRPDLCFHNYHRRYHWCQVAHLYSVTWALGEIRCPCWVEQALMTYKKVPFGVVVDF